MTHVIGQLLIGGLWCVLALSMGLFAVVLPFQIVRSLKRGVVNLNDHPIRRVSSPVLFWPLLAVGVLFWVGAVRGLLALFGVA
jgi:hypothetical protein